uniref:hypothetical protein n=1 Tax=Arthrobacter silvisoli TaxID=2291022 RepID=UPI003F49244E
MSGIFVAYALKRQLRLTRSVVRTKQRELRYFQQLEAWQQARLDAWQDDGIHPRDFEKDQPEPKDEATS